MAASTQYSSSDGAPWSKKAVACEPQRQDYEGHGYQHEVVIAHQPHEAVEEVPPAGKTIDELKKLLVQGNYRVDDLPLLWPTPKLRTMARKKVMYRRSQSLAALALQPGGQR